MVAKALINRLLTLSNAIQRAGIGTRTNLQSIKDSNKINFKGDENGN